MKQTDKFDIDGVIFDLGSTLLEYETIPWSVLDVSCIDAGYSFLRGNNYRLPPIEEFSRRYLEIREKYREWSVRTLKEWMITDVFHELLQSFNVDGGFDLAEEFFEAYYYPISRQLTLFADASFVLNSLRSMDKKIGLVSNTYFPEQYHIRELERFGLLEYFDAMIFSVNFGYRKPHPSIYKKIGDLLDTSPDRLLFVGDRYIEDCQGPRENGLHAILKYREGRDYPDPLPDNLPVIGPLIELLAYITD